MEPAANSSASAANESQSHRPLLCSKDYGCSDSSEGEQENAVNINDERSKTPVNSLNDKDASDKVSERSGSVSPELHCPICLGHLENRSFTDTCFHKFCFVCLVEWSKVKAVCPLCKQPFASIIHNVRSYNDFEQLPVSGNSAHGTNAANAVNERNRFRYRTTVVDSTLYRRRRELEALQRPSRYRHRGASRFSPPPVFTSSYRRAIYRDGLWVQSVNGINRYRDVSAAFFARNPACMHRLFPWLNRELMALLRNPADVSFMMTVILDTLQRLDINSEPFYTLVSPFLGARTRHFMHEFNSFARSPFDMAAYDTRAVYARPPQAIGAEATVAPIEFSDSSSSSHGESSSDDSDIVEIVADHSAHMTRSTMISHQSHLSSTSIRPFCRSSSGTRRLRNRSEITGPSSSTGRPSSDLRPPSSPAAGPSGTFLSLETPPHENSVATGDNVANNHAGVDSDGEVVILAVDKPWRERSPILLSSSDSEVENQLNPRYMDSACSQVSDSLRTDAITADDATQSAVSEIFVVGSSSPTNDRQNIRDNAERETSCEITHEDRRKKRSHHHHRHHHQSTRVRHRVECNSPISSEVATSQKLYRDGHRHHRHHDCKDVSRGTEEKESRKRTKSAEKSLRDSSESTRKEARDWVESDSDSDDCQVLHLKSAVLPCQAKADRRNVERDTAEGPLNVGSERDRSQMWISDDGSDSDSGSLASHGVRSAVIVPGASRFKKHSSGHKHS
jgi:E3 ubiquitin-protein ligase Topors